MDVSAVTVMFSVIPGPSVASATVSSPSWTAAFRVTLCMPESSNFTV